MYKKKLLFRNSNGTYSKEATSVESTWAYLHGIELKTTGRYRIRITKMTAAELIMMGLAPADTPEDFYGLQANLDKWQEVHGWIPVLDWTGDPIADIDVIEKELCRQFESFVTGIGVEEDFALELPKAVKSDTFKTPKRKKITKPEIIPEEPEAEAEINIESKPEVDSEDEDDWI
jgi:hypothetical protein